MAILILNTLAENSDGRGITVTDTTGQFNTNERPGGYGAGQIPNNKRDYTDIFLGFLRVIKPHTDEEDEVFIALDQTTAQDLANYNSPGNTPYSISNTVLGFDTTIDDGVYQIIYYPVFDTTEDTQNFTVTNGSATFTFEQDDQAFINLSYMLFPNDGSLTDNADNHYRIDTLDIDNLTGTFDRAYTGATATVPSGDIVWGYAYTNYVAAVYNINACLHSKVAQLVISDCNCKNESTLALMESVIFYFGIQANVDCLDFEKAQDNIDSLTDYCNGSRSGGCGCS